MMSIRSEKIARNWKSAQLCTKHVSFKRFLGFSCLDLFSSDFDWLGN